MGDLSASIQASAAGLRSSEAVYEQARRQIAAQVARSYFAIIEQQMQLTLDRVTVGGFWFNPGSSDQIFVGTIGVAF